MADELDGDRRSGAARAGAPRTISSRDILGDDRVVIIHHDNEIYRLQRTASGKLILTK
jgi:hemin uptake protein HemP